MTLKTRISFLAAIIMIAVLYQQVRGMVSLCFFFLNFSNENTIQYLENQVGPTLTRLMLL